jgi:hypothetical protein
MTVTLNDDTPPPVGLTEREVARHYRVGRAKVRQWVSDGKLVALNVGSAAKPRRVFTPEALRELERRLTEPTPTPRAARRRKRTTQVFDYYPD